MLLSCKNLKKKVFLSLRSFRLIEHCLFNINNTRFRQRSLFPLYKKYIKDRLHHVVNYMMYKMSDMSQNVCIGSILLYVEEELLRYFIKEKVEL